MARVTIAGARVSAGYTQATLAEKLGISRVHMANLENGKAELKPFYLFAICEITGFEPADILLPESLANRKD